MRVRTSKDGKQRVELTDMDRGALSKAASVLTNIGLVEKDEACAKASETICGVLAARVVVAQPPAE